jgi:hypothetical protein
MSYSIQDTSIAAKRSSNAQDREARQAELAPSLAELTLLQVPLENSPVGSVPGDLQVRFAGKDLS